MVEDFERRLMFIEDELGISRCPLRAGLEVVRGDQHRRAVRGGAVDRPVAGERDDDEQDADQGERPREPAQRRADGGLLRVAEAHLDAAVLARLVVDRGCSAEAHLRPRAP
jgi:hypothetical protein